MAEIKVVSFKVGEEEYAIDIMKIDNVSEMLKIMRLPGFPGFLLGVANLRGEVIPILDTRTKFGLEKRTENKNSRIVVVYMGDKKVGVLVDEVREVLTLDQDQLEEPPTTGVPIQARFISAIAKLTDRMLMILDIDKILSDKELEKLEQAVDTL